MLRLYNYLPRCRDAISALIGGKHVSKQLPVIRKALTCYKLLEVLLKEIECCPGLMTSLRVADAERCGHCGRAAPASKGEYTRFIMVCSADEYIGVNFDKQYVEKTKRDMSLISIEDV